MNVQLFNPPVSYYAGVHYRMLPCISLPIFNTMLTDAGHYCEVVDLEASNVMPDAFARAFLGQRDNWPDVVGFTALSTQAHGARDCIRQLRQAGYDGTVIVGGIHATTNPQDVAAWEGVDTVVTGECEGNFIDIVESGKRGIVAGQAMPINDIPSPTWERHTPAINTYWGNMAMLRPNPGIAMWTRGCPYSCIFCSDFIFYGRPTQFRPPDKIEQEWKDLKRHGCQRVYVYDDELYGVKMPDGWMPEVADRLEPYGMTWVTQARCSKRHITLDLMKNAYRAGCRVIFWGLESFSEKVLKDTRKAIKEEDIWHTLRTAREAGIENAVYTMIGNYRETPYDLEYSARELGKAYRQGLIQYRQTTVCTVMQGTRMAEFAQREGWYTPEPEAGPQMAQVYAPTPWLTTEQIQYYLRKYAEVCPVGVPG
jgi:radical SAM superfamily enzyme YgiQ (UPF0313 family)